MSVGGNCLEHELEIYLKKKNNNLDNMHVQNCTLMNILTKIFHFPNFFSSFLL